VEAAWRSGCANNFRLCRGRLAALGWEPVVAPFLVITHHSFALPEHFQAALVTSGNALPALGGLNAPLLAVGDATAGRARAAGHTDVRSANGDAYALLDLATATLNPEGAPLLLASGVNQGENLATHLRARGFRVIRRIAYAANPPHTFPPAAAAALQNHTLHAAMFMSAETARHFAALLPQGLRETLRNIIALAIGTPAVDALNPLPWRQVRLARSPSLDEVLTLL